MRENLGRYAQGTVPLGKVFFHDMLMVGTIINIATGGTALATHVAGLPGWLSLAIFLLPLPYNVALCVFVWRAAARSDSSWRDFARVGSVLWLLTVLII